MTAPVKCRGCGEVRATSCGAADCPVPLQMSGDLDTPDSDVWSGPVQAGVAQFECTACRHRVQTERMFDACPACGASGFSLWHYGPIVESPAVPLAYAYGAPRERVIPDRLDDILLRLGEVIGGKAMADDDHAALAEDAYAEIAALRSALDEALDIAEHTVQCGSGTGAEGQRRMRRIAGLRRLTRKP